MLVSKDERRIYFARVGQYVKIGVSVHPEIRLRQIRPQIGGILCPEDFPDEKPDLLGTLPGGLDREADIHADLWEWRVVGEWFDASDVVLSYVADLLRSAA